MDKKEYFSRLVDIADVQIDSNQSRLEKINAFIKQIKNPYHFKVGNISVKVKFSNESESLEKCIERIL